MRGISILLYISLFFALISCKEEVSVGDPNYPTTINTLTSEIIDQRLEELSLTPFSECTSIDSFGFCYITLKNKYCGKFDSIYTHYSKQELIDSFYQTILNYCNYFNVDDTSGIKVSSIKNLKGMDFDLFTTTYPDSSSQGWIITSNLQRIQGYDIPGTTIKILLQFNRVRSIEGKRYSNLYLPINDVFSEEMAKQSLMDQTYTYSSTSIKISSDTYWKTPAKKIYPITISNKIELRLCWELYPGKWLFIVDSQTGELLTYLNLNKI